MILEQIKSRLAELHQSGSWLARESGIRKASITEYLRGAKELTSHNLDKICQVLDLELVVKDDNPAK